MSKRAKKCPYCGARTPAGAALCSRCQTERAIRTQRIGTLQQTERPEPARREAPTQPARPAASAKLVGPSKPAESVKLVRPPKPAESTKLVKSVKPAEPAKLVRPPKPAEPVWLPRRPRRRPPSIWETVRDSRNTWQFVAVLAVILVVIVVAVVLVIKMNKPVPVEEPEEYNAVRIINQNGEDITPTQPPQAETEDTEAPADTDAPDGDEEDAGQAEAEPEVTELNDTVYVTGSGVNLRTGPSTTYEVAASLTRGTELERTGMVNDWSRVVYDGGVYYISNALISTDAPEDTDTAGADTVVLADVDMVVVNSKANLRSGPGDSYTVVAVAAAGTELERTGTSGNWSCVLYDGQEVYVHNNLITEKTVSLTAESGTLTVTAKANIRSGPGTSYSILGVAEAGSTLTTTGLTSSNWYQVSYNGQTGYIAASMADKN